MYAFMIHRYNTLLHLTNLRYRRHLQSHLTYPAFCPELDEVGNGEGNGGVTKYSGDRGNVD
jgi:hypothetical protein